MLSRFSHVRLFETLWTIAHQALLSKGFSRQEYWSGLHVLFQGIFPAQGSNPHLLRLLHCRQILCCWATGKVSVQFSNSVVSDSLWPHESQHAKPPCPSPTPRVHSNSCPSSQWCHPAISFSVIPFSSCPQSLPASGYFPISQLFTWGGQSTGVSALASVLQWTPRTDVL